jgi:RimJ/RimL family protein N-acetyltransferase
VDDLHRLWSLAEVRRYLWDDQPVSRARAEETVAAAIRSFTEHGYGQWVVFPRAGAEVIGFCGLSPCDSAAEAELLYGLAPTVWRRGFATEAAHAMLRLAFEEHGLGRVIAVCDRPNAASIRVMERLGMCFEETVALPLGEGVRYALGRADFRARGGVHVLRRG